MATQGSKRAEQIFQALCRLEGQQRQAHLEEACGTDSGLRADVELLLALHSAPSDSSDSFSDDQDLLPLTTAPSGTGTAGEPPPTVQVEGYDILRELQRGGQGVVYQAVQTSTRRKVAIKVLLEGPYASDSTRKRFEREIELIAQLKHPNISVIFHSGMTKERCRFYVMDYVRGTPLNKYVRQQKPTLEDALNLFARVCAAVNYAHQKGVIHRDLKPSNILVDAAAEPMLLDFGLAKQVHGPLETVVSVTGQVVGTLPYMSPEQTRGNPDEIDIRTDVYALGVMLYEILTGAYPYTVVGQIVEVLKHIAETPPTPPSRKWTPESGITRRGAKSLRAGRCPIDEELQTIVLKCLSKERERRYQSAGELARDIGHYLAGEPIEAKRDSGWYVLRKTLRQYRAPVAVGAALVSIVIAALFVSTTLWRQAARDRDSLKEAEAEIIAERDAAEKARYSEARQRQRAEDSLDRAQAAEREARRQAYVANITAAAASFSAGHIANTRRYLDAAPQEFRQWEWYYLFAQSDHSLAVLEGHQGRIAAVTFSPDGTILASASSDHTVRLWSAVDGRQLRELRHPDNVTAVVFSPDGSRLASVCWDRNVRLWDAASGEAVSVLEIGREDLLETVAFHPQGTRLATGSRDGTVKIWEVSSAREPTVLTVAKGPIWSLHYSPDGTRLACGCDDGTVQIWNTTTQQQQRELRGHGASVTSVSFSPDGALLASASADATVRTWDLASDVLHGVLRGHGRDVMSVAFSPDGTRIATSSDDKTIRLWDSRSLEELAVLRGHQHFVDSVCFSPDAKRLASGARDGTIRLWSGSTIHRPNRLEGHSAAVYSLAFSTDGRLLASGSADRTLRLWDMYTGESLAALRGSRRSGVRCVTFNRDGTRLAYGSGATVRLLDVSTAQELLLLTPSARRVQDLAFSPDGSMLALATGGFGTVATAGTPQRDTVRLVDATSGEDVSLLKQMDVTPGASSNFGFFAVAFSPDGARIACGSMSDSFPVRVLDVATGAEQLRLAGLGHAYAVAFSPDGSQLAAGFSEGSVAVWSSRSGQRLFSLVGHEDRVLAVAFSPDGRRLASGSPDRTVRLWDAATGDELVVLEALDPVRDVAFSGDGTRLAAALSDGSIQIWDGLPDRGRYEAHRQFLAARAAARSLVDASWNQSEDYAALATRIRQDHTLVESVRREALIEILRRAGSQSDD